MAFFEERLDPCISFGARGGPVFSTSKARAGSGRRVANRNWSRPLHRWDIGFAVRSNAQFERLRAFFYVVGGAYDGFRFKDWADFTATTSNSFLRPASGGGWQLQRVYARGNRTYARDIVKPAVGRPLAIHRLRSGVMSQLAATAFTVDRTTGIAEISDHVSGDTYVWTGEFDVPVAFESDSMEARIVDRRHDGELLMDWGSIMVEEIRA